jgi:hypothetical protein
MSLERTPFAIDDNPFLDFGTLLDNACNKLQNKQAQYSIRRLRELDSILANMERDLDKIIRLIPQNPPMEKND